MPSHPTLNTVVGDGLMYELKFNSLENKFQSGQKKIIIYKFRSVIISDNRLIFLYH